VAARVTGGLGQNQIFASGPLTLGVLERADGYAFNGLLAVGANQVLLLDRDLADLGSATYLVGGQLATVNGARLAAGQLLTSSASSSVQGRFVNGGQVASDAGVLSFFDRVGGSGGFSGNLLFLAGYDPGDTAGSIARAHFGKGGVTFDRYATLTLDVADASGYDRLLDIGALRFDGVLALHFGAGFAAAPGTVLSLLDFTSFSGSLNADRVTVDGYDRALLDFSRLAIDGTVTVTAVPEPGALALALAGLGVVALRLRRAG
jgi:uncharacterized Zn-binding protein involved in type VI secretion